MKVSVSFNDRARTRVYLQIPILHHSQSKPWTTKISGHQAPKSYARIRDAGNHRINITGTIDLSVEVRSQGAIVKFFVVDKLGVVVILGCDFCENHVEAICPRQRAVELDDGISVPITRNSIIRTKTKVRIPEPQIYAKPTRRSTGRIFTTEKSD